MIFQDKCEECGASMVDSTMDYLVEAFETTGRILCDECFEAHCEDEGNTE